MPITRASLWEEPRAGPLGDMARTFQVFYVCEKSIHGSGLHWVELEPNKCKQAILLSVVLVVTKKCQLSPMQAVRNVLEECEAQEVNHQPANLN